MLQCLKNFNNSILKPENIMPIQPDKKQATNPFLMFLNTILDGITSRFSWIFSSLTSIFNFMFSTSNGEQAQAAAERAAAERAAAERAAAERAAAERAAAERAAAERAAAELAAAERAAAELAAAELAAAEVAAAEVVVNDNGVQALAAVGQADLEENDDAPRKTPCQSFLSKASSYVSSRGFWAASGGAVALVGAAYNYLSSNNPNS